MWNNLTMDGRYRFFITFLPKCGSKCNEKKLKLAAVQHQN
jgi:hypothetical protein